nr:hypothetical protein [Tanacetum cinerariifolium]
MSRTILPPYGASSGNYGNPNRPATSSENERNPNRVEYVFHIDNTNNTDPIMSGAISPHPGASSGNLETLIGRGSHVINVPQFDVEDFTNWKERFLVYLDVLKPYHLEILENRPYVPKSPLSTSTDILIKPQKQWSPKHRRLANQDKRLKSIIISCIPNDVTRDTKIAALRLRFNAFNALEGEKVQGTFTRIQILLNALEKSDSDVEEDSRRSSEFLPDLNAEFHDRETMRPGLATIGLVDEKKPNLSFTTLVNSSLLKVKYFFTDLEGSEAVCCQVSRRESQSKKQVAETQHAEESVAIADATKSL